MTPWERPPTGPAADIAAAMARLVPVLETPRLRLRAPQIDDARAIGLAFTDDAEDAWLDFNQMTASWYLRGFGPWTVETHAGTPVAFLPVDHEYGDPEPEIGWFTAKAHRGQGYATEAGAAALAHIFGPLKFATIVSYVDADNAASARVSERLGGRRDPVAEAAIDHACHVFRHHPRANQ